MPRYDFKPVESRWQQYWEEHHTFRTPDVVSEKKKLYVLDMFPYPSGSGLHVGHPEGYTATDIVCRYSRMKGLNVLHPMGWDAFGLPAEEHAVKTGTHPRETTNQNITTFKRQLKMLGFSYDWERELATTDPDYYRWTQWIFLQIFDTWYDSEFEWTGPDGVKRKGKGRPISELPIPSEVKSSGTEAVRRYQDKHRLAYVSDAPVNWCPALGTVLANEEIIDGKSERGGHPVVRMPLKQWMLRITAYGDRLANELDPLTWSEAIKLMQRNWIGRSVGAEVDFKIASQGFTTEVTESTEGNRRGSQQEGEASKSNSEISSGLSVSSVVQTAIPSENARSFPKEPSADTIRVYTTRPDTLFGVTYMVLAPEHPLVDKITTPEQRAAVDEYCTKASLKSDLDRTDLAKDKTGVFTGGYAINPVNGEKVPVWIADYVLISYGTGAIMAVPAHDERDFEFAKEFNIPIIRVVDLRDSVPFVSQVVTNAEEREEAKKYKPPSKNEVASGEKPWPGPGWAINSGKYDGLPTAEFKAQIIKDLTAAGLGKEAVNYRLRDWLFSRQRYWGEPFPIWHELDADGNPTGLMRADTAESLPVLHPHMEDFKPTGTPEPMLAKATPEWLFKTDTDGVKLKRETNSMPQWAGSCWYYLRFCDNKNSTNFIDPAKEKYWLPVDLYIGGAEHAVLHLLYSRFWHKVLFDRGHVSTPEPFQKLVNQGMILGEPMFFTFTESLGSSPNADPHAAYSIDDVELKKAVDGTMKHFVKGTATEVSYADVSYSTGVDVIDGKAYLSKLSGLHAGKGQSTVRLGMRSEKMSKSRGNVINPDEVVKDYGADSLRLYEMFMGPLEQTKPWQMSGVEGVYRFLGRVWRMIVDERAETVKLADAVVDAAPSDEQLRVLHKTIKAVTDDIDRLSFNTAISRMMEFSNFMSSQEARPKAVLSQFVQLLSPFAPHIAEELWNVLGHPQTLAYEPWPTYDPALLVEDTVEVPVQFNGKLRSKIVVPANSDAASMEAAARADEQVQKHLEGKTVVKVIAVPGRMVNFVVK